ncbi:MAG: endonuclease V [Desulfomonile tiedjei]|nr:endonuclease V [Desulfomonile tiedjei]
MIAALDVCYHKEFAVAACVIFEEWDSERTVRSIKEPMAEVKPYEPGSFYKRELPCLLELLRHVEVRLEAVIVDGYVWLGPEYSPGLGAHLYWALEGKVAVIGVAKSPFKGAPNAHKVLRGRSTRPLYVTSAEIDPTEAARKVEAMHGSHRIPTLLKMVDRLCRTFR